MRIEDEGRAHEGREPASGTSGEHGGRARVGGPLLAFALAAALLGGCSLLPDRASDPEAIAAEAERRLELEAPMLDDLVAALAQLHTPRVSTLQVALEADDGHERALVERLAALGYGIQRVDADQGPRHVTLSRRQNDSPEGIAFVTLELAVGATTLTRSYARDERGVRPAGALIVGGTRRALELDDTRFGPQADGAHTRVVHTGSAPVPADMPLISLITDEVVRGVAREAVQGSRSPSAAAVNSGRLEVANLFYGDGGAFGALREGFETAERLTVIFPNDSMRLGAEGKRQIERFVEGYREGSDMIGLIGCSNGPTALAIGNEGLALGRSGRIAEELVALGVARDRVIDEGCWSSVGANGRFPSRGVVVELLRSAS